MSDRAIFISYRRATVSGWAGRISDSLDREFPGGVVMDVDIIRPGDIFSDVLQRHLDTCEHFLVLIDPNWIDARDSKGLRRLDDPDDWVRLEVREALKRTNVRVIPVLLDGASMPNETQLPEDLRTLARRHAAVLTHQSYGAQMKELLSVLRPDAPAAPQKKASGGGRTGLIAAGGAAVIALAGGAAFFALSPGDAPEPKPWKAETVPAAEPPAWTPVMADEAAPEETAADATEVAAFAPEPEPKPEPEPEPEPEVEAEMEAAPAGPAPYDGAPGTPEALRALRAADGGGDSAPVELAGLAPQPERGAVGGLSPAPRPTSAPDSGGRAPQPPEPEATDAAELAPADAGGAVPEAGTQDASGPRPEITLAMAAPDAADAPVASAPDPEPLSALPDGPFSDCGLCPEMVALAGGVFEMGDASEPAEAPVHEVALAPFALGIGEVTVAQYASFATETGRGFPAGCFVWTQDFSMSQDARASWIAPGYAIVDATPVSCVSFEDASAYADWIADLTGLHYRLPSEAEMEYAIRAGSTSRYFWGEETDGACAAANAADESSSFIWRNSACDDGAAHPVASGVFPRNAFGIGEIVGNLWEWTADCWNGSHAGAAGDGAPRRDGACGARTVRGGSWDDPVENLRSSHRVSLPVTRRQANLGFRVARDFD